MRLVQPSLRCVTLGRSCRVRVCEAVSRAQVSACCVNVPLKAASRCWFKIAAWSSVRNRVPCVAVGRPPPPRGVLQRPCPRRALGTGVGSLLQSAGSSSLPPPALTFPGVGGEARCGVSESRQLTRARSSLSCGCLARDTLPRVTVQAGCPHAVRHGQCQALRHGQTQCAADASVFTRSREGNWAPWRCGPQASEWPPTGTLSSVTRTDRPGRCLST